MANISIEVAGVELALARLNKVNNVLWTRAPMRQSLRLLQEKMADYPPEMPGQKYKRTGDLGKYWTVETLEYTPQRVHMRVGTNVRYAPWVQARNFQARIHRGRWLTEAAAVEQNRKQIAAIFEAAIRRVAG